MPTISKAPQLAATKAIAVMAVGKVRAAWKKSFDVRALRRKSHPMTIVATKYAAMIVKSSELGWKGCKK